MDKIIEVNNNYMEDPKVGNDLYDNRSAIAKIRSEDSAEVTISIQAFNRLEKTKRCVESILKYTKGIDYELLLVDSGSSDGTFEYYKSVPHEKKKVVIYG